jgi:hypothetical protein
MSGVMAMMAPYGDVKKAKAAQRNRLSSAYIATVPQTKGAACLQAAPPLRVTRVADPKA